MSSALITQQAWQAFAREDWFQALKLFQQAEEALGVGLFGYNIAACQRALADAVRFPYPVFDFGFSKAESLSLQPLSLPVIAGMATMPSRVPVLEKVLQQVLPQISHLHLYLNNFTSVPDFLHDPKITLHRSQEHGDLRDNGKFFGIQFSPENAYYFTLDDDLNYPHGYFSKLVEKIEFYQRQAVVGLHGVTYARFPRRFFDRVTFNFERRLQHDMPVSVLGTGTCGFYLGTVRPTMADFPVTGMADLVFAAYLKQQQLPLVAIARPAVWLEEFELPEQTESIYQQTRANTEPYDRFLQQTAPWGLANIQQQWLKLWSSLDAAAVDFVNCLTQLEQGSELNLQGTGLFTASSYLHETTGIYCFSDNIYKQLLAALLRPALAAFPAQDQWGAFYQDLLAYFELSEESHDLSALSPLEQQVLSQEVSCYLQLSGSAELKALHHAYRAIAGDKLNGLYLTELLHLLLAMGAVELIEKHYHQLSVAMNHELMVQSFKAAIYANSPLVEQLLPKVRAITNVSQKSMLEALYQLAKSSSKADHCLASLLRLPFRGKTKYRFVNEVVSRYLLTDLQPNSSVFMPLLQDQTIDKGLLKKLCELLLLKEVITEPELAAVVLGILAEQVPAEEWLLWQAEVQTQSQPGSVALYDALNNQFALAGLAQLQKPAERPEHFYHSLQCTADTASAADRGNCTVVIAAYNADDTLQYAYDSIAKQTYPNLTIIVVDDCSKTPASSFLKQDPARETIVIRNEQNLGPYGCRNRALQQANGEYFLVHDADDWAHPEKVAAQISAIADSEYVCSYTRHIRVSASGHLKLENHGAFIGHGPMTSLFKMEVFHQIGGFDAVPTRGDMEFKSRIVKAFGQDAMHEDQRLMLLALDWVSNSKQKTATLAKQYGLKQYKNIYHRLHALVPFVKSAIRD